MSRSRDRRKKEARRAVTPIGTATATLLPIDEAAGFYLALGAGDLGFLGAVEPLSLFDVDGSYSDRIAEAVHVLNLGSQAAHGLSEVRGLVKLAPETMKALRGGAKPLMKDGWNLGTVATDGKLSHSVRWLPANGAKAVKIMSALGPAAALMAVQWKLGQINRAVERNIALTHQVLLEARQERWEEINSQWEEILRAYRLAMEVGSVTSANFHELAAQGPGRILGKHRNLARQSVQTHVLQLSACTTPSERRDFFRSSAQALLNDVQSLIKAEEANLVFQALRAASRQSGALEDPRLAKEMDIILREALLEKQKAEELVRDLVGGLYRQMRLLEQCPGTNGWFTFGGAKRAPEQVAAAARQFADVLGAHPGMEPAAIHSDAVMWLAWLDVDRRVALVDRLRWVLDMDERLLAVLWGSVHEAIRWSGSGFIVFTDRRILLLRRSDFLERAEVQRSLPWHELGELALSARPGLNGGHDIETSLSGTKLYLQATSATSAAEMTALTALLRRHSNPENHHNVISGQVDLHGAATVSE